MINTSMRLYDFFTLGTKGAYGQLTKSSQPVGSIKMSISLTEQSIQDNINYQNAKYVGLTHNNKVDSSYVIKYGDLLLKVLYVNPDGRYNQVFMTTYD